MKISNQKLGIGVPCTFPFIPASFFYSFVMMKKPEFIFIHADNGPVDTLRNDIVEKAIDCGCTHLLMMDVDQVYHEDTIPVLLGRKLPIVGAMVCRRYPPFDPIIMRVNGPGYETIPTTEKDELGLVECDATGAGCVMYDMSVFKKMPYPWFKFTKEEDGRTIGEDIGFCQDLKAAGYRIFVDTTVPAGHLATMIINEATHRLYSCAKSEQQKQNMETALKNEAA